MTKVNAYRCVFGTTTITDTEINYVMALAMDELRQARSYFCLYHVDEVRLAGTYGRDQSQLTGELVNAARDDWRRALAVVRRLRENGAGLDSLEARMFARQRRRRPMASDYPDLLTASPVVDVGWRCLVKKDGKTVRAYKMKAQAIAFVDGCVFAGVKPKRLEIAED